MKKTICLITMFLVYITASVVLAEEKEVKYAVTISVTYNAISIADATEIACDAMLLHQEACKNEIKIKKVNNQEINMSISGSNFILLDTATGS